ncbi:unnamed protein product, partial [Ectocarpus sp. 8 AP-2014]
ETDCTPLSRLRADGISRPHQHRRRRRWRRLPLGDVARLSAAKSPSPPPIPGCDATNSFLDNVREALVDKAREVRDAIGTKKYDELTLFKGKGRPTVHVPTGRVVVERAWAELDARRTVRFSPRIGGPGNTVLVPTRKETFPKPADVAASFVTAEERAGAEREISPTGSGRSEWQALLLETRDEARERQEAPAQLQRERDQEEEQRQERQ